LPASFSPSPDPRIAAAKSIHDLGRLGKASWSKKLEALEAVAPQWSQMDSLTEFSLLPRFKDSLQARLSEIRNAIKKENPIQLTENYLRNRIQAIEIFELKTNAVLGRTQWSSVRAAILAEQANVYRDLSAEIHAVKAPKGLQGADLDIYKQTIAELSIPFEQKQENIRQTAQTLVAKQLCCDMRATLIRSKKLFPLGAEKFYSNFLSAYENKNLPLMAFLVQEANSRKLEPEGLVKLLAAASLFARGEGAEAWVSFLGAYEDLDRPSTLNATMAINYWKFGERDKAADLTRALASQRDPFAFHLSAEELKDLRGIYSELGSNELFHAVENKVKAEWNKGNRVPGSRKEKL
jgi:hypothetical protein